MEELLNLIEEIRESLLKGQRPKEAILKLGEHEEDFLAKIIMRNNYPFELSFSEILTIFANDEVTDINIDYGKLEKWGGLCEVKYLELVKFKFEVKLFEKIEYDPDIEWWNVNRKIINDLIDKYNNAIINYAIKGEIDEDEFIEIIEEAEFLIETSESRGRREFTDWQIDSFEDIIKAATEILEKV